MNLRTQSFRCLYNSFIYAISHCVLRSFDDWLVAAISPVSIEAAASIVMSELFLNSWMMNNSVLPSRSSDFFPRKFEATSRSVKLFEIDGVSSCISREGAGISESVATFSWGGRL